MRPSYACSDRKDLPAAVLEEIGRRKPLLKNYPVKRALAFHPRAPRLVTFRLLRELYLMDLVQLTLLPGIPVELKRNAEDQLIARLPSSRWDRKSRWRGAVRRGLRELCWPKGTRKSWKSFLTTRI
jgi:hypothetical protein